MLNANFAGELFGPGQPLDVTRYFIIIAGRYRRGKIIQAVRRPADAISPNTTTTTRAGAISTGHRAPRRTSSAPGFGNFRWRDANLGLGRDVSGLHGRAGAARVQPVEIAGRNWITRRMMIDAIRNDPEWNGGNYTKQPRSLQAAASVLQYRHQWRHAGAYKAAPTQEKADQLVNQRLAQNVQPTPMT